MACGTEADIAISCTAPATQGAFDTIYIMRKTVWDDAVNANKTVVNASTNIVTALLLDTGDQAYALENPVGAVNGSSTQVIADSGRPLYTHLVEAKVEPTASNSVVLQAYAENLYVIIVGKKGSDPAQKYMVYGKDAGMRLEVNEYSTNTNGGMIQLSFMTPSTPVQNYEPKQPVYVNVGSAAGNEAAVIALLTPAA